MRIVTGADKAISGGMAAADAARRICAAIEERGEARVVFASAASQFEFFEALLSHEEIDWSKVACFHLDEYTGLSADHPASFRRFLRDRFISNLPCPPRSFEFISGDAQDISAECARLEASIREKPVDLACIGIGENGHIAFNDPPADFTTARAYAVVELDERCRLQQVGEGWYASLEEVPRSAVSMTVPQIMSARSLVVIVPDGRKAEAVAAAVDGPLSEMCPASVLRNHADCVLYLDPQSAAGLKTAKGG